MKYYFKAVHEVGSIKFKLQLFIKANSVRKQLFDLSLTGFGNGFSMAISAVGTMYTSFGLEEEKWKTVFKERDHYIAG